MKKLYSIGKAAALLWISVTLLFIMTSLSGSHAASKGKIYKDLQYVTYDQAMVSSYLKGRFLELEGRWADASSYYGQALSFEPENIDLLEKAYTHFILKGDFDRALPLVQRHLDAMTAENDDLPAHLVQLPNYLLVLDAIRRGALDEAKALAAPIQSKLDREPVRDISYIMNHTLYTLTMAWLNSAEGNTSRALELADGLKISESFKVFQKVQILHRAGRNDEAIALLESQESMPLSAKTVGLSYFLYLQSDDVRKANQLVQEFQRTNPDMVFKTEGLIDIKVLSRERLVQNVVADVLQEIAALMQSYNAYQNTQFILQLSHFVRPNNGMTNHSLGELAEERKQYDLATHYYGSVSEHSGFFWRSQIRMAITKYRAGETEEAKKQLLLFADMRQDDTMALLTLGDLLLEEDEFLQAVDIYSRALDRIELVQGQFLPDDWAVFYARAIAYERSNNWAHAEADLRKALELNPGQPDVLNYLGYSWLVMQQNIEEAEEMLMQAIRKRPYDGQILDSYGWAKYLMGHYREAQIFLERAAELLPKEPVINDHLGDLYWRTGRKIEAKFQWKRSLHFQKDDSEKAKLQQKLEYGLQETAPKDALMSRLLEDASPMQN